MAKAKKKFFEGLKPSKELEAKDLFTEEDEAKKAYTLCQKYIAQKTIKYNGKLYKFGDVVDKPTDDLIKNKAVIEG